MKDEAKSGVLVVGHGSRREEANRDVREAARRIGERGGFSLVEAAFLEIEHPNIAEGFKSLVERGACKVTVYLVGAGPGDPGLLTLRAYDLLRSADLIVYDYLVDPDVLELAAAAAERRYVGKVGGGKHTPQSEINQLLIAQARAGRRVVRLKSGDPFVFGRGGEEAEALSKAAIAFEVVPGISSALAVPAYAGIPLTHRDVSSSVAILTGTSSGDVDDVSAAIADLSRADTIVILMGVANLRLIADDLIVAGRDPETPAAVIRWGTYETQQTVAGTLQSIADDAGSAGMRPPGVIIIGEVVRLRQRLKWFEKELAESAELSAVFAEV